MTTQEQENFYRHSTGIVDETKDSFLHLLDFHLTNQGITLERFIQINEHEIYHHCYNRYPCCQCPPGTRAETRGSRVLHPPQMDILFNKTGTKLPVHNLRSKSAPNCCCPVNPNLQLLDLDFTLARFLLVNFTTLVPLGSPERNALDNLVKIRNESYGHAKEGKIPNDEYKKSMAEIENSLLVLAKVYGKEAETKQSLRDIAKQPLNPALCLQLQSTLLQQCQIDETMKQLIAELKLPEYLIRDLKDISVVEGNDARLQLWTRERDVIVEWFKGDLGIEASDKYVVETLGQVHSLIVANADLTDRGIYEARFLESKRTANIDIEEYFTKNMGKTFDCIEGDNVDLSCAVCEANIPAHWTKDGVVIQQSAKYIIKHTGKSHMLSIKQLGLEDAADYSVTINNRTRSSSIIVKGYFTKNPQDIECIEGETAEFTCEVKEDNLPAHWNKNGIQLKNDGKYEIFQAGKFHRLSIKKSELHDTAKYSVIINNRVREASLVVIEYFTKPLISITCIEGETVQFECEVLGDNQAAMWYKDGTEVITSDKYKAERHGRLHRLVVINAKLDDNGEYFVKIKNCVRHSELIVQVSDNRKAMLSRISWAVKSNTSEDVHNQEILYSRNDQPKTTGGGSVKRELYNQIKKPKNLEDARIAAKLNKQSSTLVAAESRQNKARKHKDSGTTIRVREKYIEKAEVIRPTPYNEREGVIGEPSMHSVALKNQDTTIPKHSRKADERD